MTKFVILRIKQNPRCTDGADQTEHTQFYSRYSILFNTQNWNYNCVSFREQFQDQCALGVSSEFAVQDPNLDPSSFFHVFFVGLADVSDVGNVLFKDYTVLNEYFI